LFYQHHVSNIAHLISRKTFISDVENYRWLWPLTSSVTCY